MQPNNGSQLPVPLSQTQALQQYVYLEPVANVPGEGDASVLVDNLYLLLFRKWTLVLFAMLGLLLAAIVSYLITPVYQARTTIEIEAAPDNAGASRLGQEQGGSSVPPESYVNTQARILTSKSLLQAVNRKMDEKPYVHSGRRIPRAAAWIKALGLPARLASADSGNYGDCKVRVLENTRMIEVTCDAPDPRIASDYANLLVQEYLASNVSSRWQAAQHSTTWLTNQLADLKKQLESAEAELRDYRANSGLTQAGGQEVRMERLLKLQEELSRASSERTARQAAFEDVRKSPPDSGEAAAKLAGLRRELTELSSQYGPEHDQVKRVQAQIEELESGAKTERASALERAEGEYRAAQRREAVLNAEFAAQAAAVSDKSSKSRYADILAQEVTSLRSLYSELLRKVKETAVASTLNVNLVRVVDVAEPPPAPYKPNLTRNLIIGLGTGLLFGIGFVLAGEWANRRLEAPGETPFHLRVPELGVIPEHKPAGPSASTPKLTALRSGDEGPAYQRNVALVTWQDRPSPTAESFRGALASILIGGRNRVRPGVILMTSPARGDGKSTTVSNVGISLAEIGQRVVLVDADIRKPQMHNIFGLPNNWGLSDLLRDRTPLDLAPLQALVRETRVDNLYVLPSGPGAASISNLLYSNRLPQLIDRLRKEFDTVIIDTPPMLYVADARVLGRVADAAILVLRAGKTTRDEAMHAKQRLVEDGIQVMGTILNAYDPRTRARHGYGAYYGNYSEDADGA